MTPTAMHHTCFLVKDVDGTAQKMADALRIGPFSVWTITPEKCTVHGKESPYSFRVALATVGGGTIELIAPAGGHTVYEERLKTRGEGFHHICFAYPTADAVNRAKADLRNQGRDMIQEGSAGDLFDFAYFAFPEIDSAVEVMYLNAAKLPPPEKVIEPR